MTLETAIMTIKFLWPLVLGLSIVIIDKGQYLRAETVTLSASQRQQLRSLDAKIILPNYIPPGFRASEIKILAEEGMDTQSSLKMPRIAVFWWKESKTPGAMMV
jgi:hypothetical protein